MYKTEIDVQCEINAPKSTSWNIFKNAVSEELRSTGHAVDSWSKWLWILPALVTIAAILLASVSLAHGHPDQPEPVWVQPVQRIVIEGQRMSAQEKLDFDLAPERIARVEIVGRRLPAQP